MSHSRSPYRLSKWPSKFLWVKFQMFWTSTPKKWCWCFALHCGRDFVTFVALYKGAKTPSRKLVWLYFGARATPVMQTLIGIIRHLKVTTFNVFMQSLSGLRQLANQIWSQLLMLLMEAMSSLGTLPDQLWLPHLGQPLNPGTMR